MATQTQSGRVDVGAMFEAAAAQFRDLNPKEPGQWPLLPKLIAWFAVTLVVILLFWFALLSGAHDEFDAEQAKEPVLKSDYRAKLGQAVNLAELRKQKLQVEEYVTQLEKQLPGKAEMDALLSDINQAGIGRGLQFELFRPGAVVVKDYYAELPISIRVSGRYHDIGAFAADIANLSRIVTLHDLAITSPIRDANAAAARDASGGILSMEAVARTYRYLDPSEVEAVQQAAAKAKRGNK